MSSVAPLEYESRVVSSVCPICNERPTTAGKSLYGYPVCKKCISRFGNRRQFAFVVDFLLFFFAIINIFAWPAFFLDETAALSEAILGVVNVVGLLMMLLWLTCRDGFDGRSPGKRLMGLQVVDEMTGRPITFVGAFRRESFFILVLIPVLGSLALILIVVTIAIQMRKGHRLGDRIAGRRVIWRKYADSPVFGGKGSLCLNCRCDIAGNVSGVCPECRHPTKMAIVPITV